MKVVADTSIWIAFFRGRAPAVRRTLDALLDADRVLLPVPVRIELLTGVRRAERERLSGLLDALELLVPERATWRTVEEWALRGAAAGERFGVADLLIAALAAEQGAAIWSADQDFRRMASLGYVACLDA